MKLLYDFIYYTLSTTVAILFTCILFYYRFIGHVANPSYNNTTVQEVPLVHNYDMPKGEGVEQPELNLVNPLYHPSIPVSPSVSPTMGPEHPSQPNTTPREYEVASPSENRVHQYEDIPNAIGDTEEYGRLENRAGHDYAVLESCVYSGETSVQQFRPDEMDDDSYAHLQHT